jgi:hypothetical protein
MKLMPSATELRDLCSIDSLIDVTITNTERAAKFGDTSHTLEIPPTMSIKLVKERLSKEFPGCRIIGRWFTRHLDIRWG